MEHRKNASQISVTAKAGAVPDSLSILPGFLLWFLERFDAFRGIVARVVDKG